MTATLSGHSKPRATGREEVVVVDGEAVVYADGAVHVLNPSATIVWESCDGTVTLEVLAGDIAASFGISTADARRDVFAAAEELLARHLITMADRVTASREDVRPADVFQPSAACSGCGEGPSYEHHLVVGVGEIELSIGADAEVVSALEAAFGPRAIERVEVPRQRASYGVVLPRPDRHSGAMELARLHRGPDVLLASRDPERVLRALVAQVALHDVPAPRVRLEGVAVGTAARVMVTAVPTNRNAYARAAARHGLRVSDTTAVAIDHETAEAIHGPSWADLDLGALGRVAGTRRHLGTEPEPLPWGRAELVGLAVDGSIGAASVLGEMGNGRSWDTVPSLRSLLDLTEAIPIVPGAAPDQVAARLRQR